MATGPIGVWMYQCRQVGGFLGWEIIAKVGPGTSVTAEATARAFWQNKGEGIPEVVTARFYLDLGDRLEIGQEAEVILEQQEQM